jgi:hypothetical protein
MRAAVLVLVSIAALALAGCGGSSKSGSPSDVSYTLRPLSPLGAGITVQISGPAAPAQLVLRRFKASRRGDFTSASAVSGAKDCAVLAGGGKVTIRVYGSNGLSQTLCNALKGAF